MKIGIDTRVLTNCKAGFNRYVSELVEAMRKIAPENTYICYIDKKNDLLNYLTLKRAWGSIENHIIGDIWEQLKLPVDLYREKVNVYHGTIGRLPRLRLGVKYVVTIHDLNPIRFRNFYSHSFNWFMSTMLRWSANVADRIIAISDNTKKEIIEFLNVPEEKIKVIYSGVNEHWKPIDFESNASLINYRYGIQVPYILTVSNIEPKKNLPRLFSAYSMLKKNKDIREQLVIVGPKGWKAENIIDCSRAISDGVVFTGHLNDYELRILYSGAKLFVLPSLHEGFGLPLLEAMACGAPVIASNVAAIPEIVGDAAVLFNPSDIEEIAQTIETTLANEELLKRMREKGLKRVNLFSWEKTARETLKIYKELYNQK